MIQIVTYILNYRGVFINNIRPTLSTGNKVYFNYVYMQNFVCILFLIIILQYASSKGYCMGGMALFLKSHLQRISCSLLLLQFLSARLSQIS